MISKYLLLVFTFIAINLGATGFAQQVLFPESIQACIDDGECETPVLVASSSSFGPDLIQQYRLTFNDGSGYVSYLYRYLLGENSDFQRTEVTLDGPVSTQARFSGVVWLLARERYSLSERPTLPHTMTLYTEQITGSTAFEASGSSRGEIRIDLSSEALLAGGGSFLATLGDYDDDGDGDGEPSINSDGPLVCLAPGCGVGASFNLVGINYEQMGNQAVTGLIPPFANLEGQLLYSQERFFPGFYSPTHSFDEESRLFVGTPVPPLLGDCNLDGSVNFLDISPFIVVLSSGDYLAEADCNLDDVVNFLDISRFIEILSGN